MTGRRKYPPATGPDMPAGNGSPGPGYVYQGTQPDEGGSLPPDERCGKYAGWSAHQRAKEKPCDPCQEAHATYMQAYRLRTGRVKTIRVRPSAALIELLARSAGGGEDRWS